MSSLSLLSVYLSGASLIFLLTAVSEAQYYDLTPAPDYDDYSATFEYSLYSNTSSDDLEKFIEQFIDPEEEDTEDTGSQREEEDVTVTTAMTRVTTEQDGVYGRNAASLPVSLEITTLIWTLMILISLNVQQLQQTL